MIGWQLRNEHLLTPETGLGYWLGIVGATAMVLLLVYPLRKRVASLRAIGSVTFWFRTHMALGIIGPILILYHANFGFGSTNANVALVSMLLVAGSGLIGRYLYGKIHRGSAGRIDRFQQLIDTTLTTGRAAGLDATLAQHLKPELQAFAKKMLPRIGNSIVVPVYSVLMFPAIVWSFRRRVNRETKRLMAEISHNTNLPRAQRAGALRHADAILDDFVLHLREARAAALFVRLFALWHVLHMPLFLLLLIAATLHVIAVHIY